MRDRLFVLFQYLLPRYALTALVYRIARIRVAAVKNFLIEKFVKFFSVELEGVKGRVPDDFETFNAFFVRELEAGARPVDADARSIVSPVDGTLSAAGPIKGDTIFQAKGIYYRLSDLLMFDTERAEALRDGSFATIYLAPYNYHRVHAAHAGRIDALHYVPGDLFSVNAGTVRHLRGLFRRNERLVVHFDTDFGPAALVFIGALNVGSITTPWTGEIRPRRRGSAEALQPGDAPLDVTRGDLLGWFNMGSTVILLLPPGAAEWRSDLAPGRSLLVGETIGSLGGASDGSPRDE